MAQGNVLGLSYGGGVSAIRCPKCTSGLSSDPPGEFGQDA